MRELWNIFTIIILNKTDFSNITTIKNKNNGKYRQ